MSEDRAGGFVEGLFDRAKAVRLEMLLEKIGVAMEVHGEELRGLCPIPAHKGEKKKASFYVKPTEQVFHCFGCKAGGNIVKFAQEYNGLAVFESKKAALWIVETMEKGEERNDEAAAPEQQTETVDSEEMLVRLFTCAGEQIIAEIAKHADNPKPLAEKLARWVVEVLR